MSTSLSPSVGYEFDSNENTIIGGLAGAMRFVAVIELLIGVVYGGIAVYALMVQALFHAIGYAISCIVTIVLAAMLNTAAGHFRTVVRTRGSDIQHLLGALDELGSYFKIKRLLYIIGLSLIALGIAFVFLFMMRSQ